MVSGMCGLLSAGTRTTGIRCTTKVSTAPLTNRRRLLKGTSPQRQSYFTRKILSLNQIWGVAPGIKRLCYNAESEFEVGIKKQNSLSVVCYLIFTRDKYKTYFIANSSSLL